MLVLSRQRDEVIMIGDDIRITIVDIRGNQIRVGIDAPKSVPVHRLEVWEQRQRKQRDTEIQTQTAEDFLDRKDLEAREEYDH